MRAAKMSERRRSAVALNEAHAFSVEALISSIKSGSCETGREKGLDLSMEALSAGHSETRRTRVRTAAWSLTRVSAWSRNAGGEAEVVAGAASRRSGE